ncbi:hypothetical protein GYMLUDRAFT_77592 [Collybiopsis luxurians FD-317 M1]|uniref:Unplaced genomic scaffold GYMLUscaffold_86, whole genome shotgun sequence n=1 Tax=Collybiopsis luxurians FD-317 M1 TaxID=944289 RepID=A0A0D0C5D2_9AGAR|nr:hypothetical protein GYMLUDRAFT_77592 [Collybiopsis luxurians FD-317 M1]
MTLKITVAGIVIISLAGFVIVCTTIYGLWSWIIRRPRRNRTSPYSFGRIPNNTGGTRISNSRSASAQTAFTPRTQDGDQEVQRSSTFESPYYSIPPPEPTYHHDSHHGYGWGAGSGNVGGDGGDQGGDEGDGGGDGGDGGGDGGDGGGDGGDGGGDGGGD